MSMRTGGMGLDVSELEEMARRCRVNIVKMTHAANSGHPGGSLSAIDLLSGLYGTKMRIDPHDSNWTDRDRFIMSKGHASPAVYSILNEVGYLSEDDLYSFREFGSVCQGHVDMKWTDGVDFSAGSLGMGLSFGIGCALAARMDDSDRNIWVMLGDGEIQEGEVWEAFMAADFHSIGNLKVIIDRNRIQNDDFVHLQMEVGDVVAKLASFGWTVKEMNSRYKLMSKVGVRNIDGYNSKHKLKMPYIVVVVDEMSDLMLVAGKEIENYIQKLSQMARAAGIHIIMATQRPSVDVITGTIKALSLIHI